MEAHLRDTKRIRGMMLGLDAPVPLMNGGLAPAVNLDNAATTPAFKQVAREVEGKLRYYGSIGRGRGQKSEISTEIYTRGRQAVTRFLGADDGQYTVFYANNTTDGINKLASALITSPDDIVLTTRMEHHANDLPWRERARTVYAEVDGDGRLLLDDIERLLWEHKGAVKLVSVTAASNVTGYVNDVHAIARVAHQYGALMAVDGAQIVAHRHFSMLGNSPEENIDFFTFSAHKMYSPFGGGAVVGRRAVLDQRLPVFYGGGMVEAVCDDGVVYSEAPDRYEAGSPNYPGVVGMLTAMEILRTIGFEHIQRHERALMRLAILGLLGIPGVTLYADNDNIADRVGILVFNLQGMTPLETAEGLAGQAAIAVRHAAFCAHPYVRRLTGVPDPKEPCVPPEGMVRVSFGVYNDERDVDCLLRTVRKLLRCGAQASDGRLAAARTNDRA